jgi:hypothetical protein
MGLLIKITGEFFYTSILTMIVLMTVSGIYVFKITYLVSSYRTALLAFFIFILNPVIFRLNFEPYSQQFYLMFACIMIYYLLLALQKEPRNNFVYAGIFAFLSLASRPEALFLIIPFCLLAYLTKKEGYVYFIMSALLFQVIWIIISYVVYGTPFKTFQAADQYTAPADIEQISAGLRLKGFFLPYYFLVLGLTFFVFYYFVKGVIVLHKKYPSVILLVLLLPVLIPAIINGIAGAKSTIYHTTHYIYLVFFISPVIAAVGLQKSAARFSQSWIANVFAVIVILTCIPLSYIKDFVPEKYNKLFPKVIQFIVTTEEPDETRVLLKYIDENIKKYPSLIFDSSENSSSIFYVPFRTKLAPPDKILISDYNQPSDEAGLKKAMYDFMYRNSRGIIIVRKSETMMNKIIKRTYAERDIDLKIVRSLETNLWMIYLFEEPHTL